MMAADGYHAGKDASVRARVQKDFMAGKLRIVVATVAFGMVSLLCIVFSVNIKIAQQYAWN